MRFLNFIRAILWLLWSTLTVIPYALAVVLVSIVIRGQRLYWMCVGWLWLSIQGAKWLCGIRWREQGRENFPDGAAIIAPKHQSAWETFAMTFLCPRPLCFVFKRELLYIPFFGWAMARLDMIHIDRSQRAQAWNKVLKRGRQLLAQGNWVIMFPEGTRTPRGSQGIYKSGAARLAVEANVPIVPVAVTSARCWPKSLFVKIPGVIDVSYGPPIYPNGRTPDEVMAEVERWIETEMRRLDPEAYAGPDIASTAKDNASST